MRSLVHFDICAIWRRETHGDIDTVISEDNSSIRRGELGGRHCELYVYLDVVCVEGNGEV